MQTAVQLSSIQKSKNSITRRRIQKLFANRLAIFGLFIALLVTLMCICAPLLTKWDPTLIDMSKRYAPPSSEHIFGCDQSGRDIWARLLYGGRVSIMLGIVCSLCANTLGAMIGCVAGYFGGRTDRLIMFISEVFGAFPNMMLILIIRGFSKGGVWVLLCIWIFTGWGGTMRLVRSRILSLKHEVFVESCQATGVSSRSIMFSHLLPNSMGVYIINISSSVAGYVLGEAGLSFLGLGVPKGIPTWGNMLNAARSLSTMQNHPMLWILPGIAISIFVLGVNFFGDGLRDVFDVAEE